MCPTSLNKMLFPQLKEPFPFAYKNLVQTIVPLSAAQSYFEMLCKGLFQVICYNQCPLFFFSFLFAGCDSDREGQESLTAQVEHPEIAGV